MQEKLSVLMPVYNVEKFLEASVRSVVGQTSKQWELIMVDDGSTDSSGAICDRYAAVDPRITVIHQENSGSVSARKAAIKKASTEFCIFLDSDDFLAPHCVETILHTINRTDADIILYGFQQYNDEQFGERFPAVDREQQIPTQLFRKALAVSSAYNSLCTKAIRTAYLKESPLMKQDIALSIGEDKLMLLYPATRAAKIAAIPDILYFYRTNANSLTHTFSGRMLKERLGLEIADITYSYVRLWKMDTPDIMEGMSVLLWKNAVGVANLFLLGKCNREAKMEVKKMGWKKRIPPFILPYQKCGKLTWKDRLKLLWFTQAYG